MRSDQPAATVLVLSDDAELGGLIALNLRVRGLPVEHADLARALAPRWAPAAGSPALLVVAVVAPPPRAVAHLRQVTVRSWARGVPLLLLADDPARLARALAPEPGRVLAPLGDVRALVDAVRARVGSITPAG